jgi:dihydroorotate dehydrogenase
MLAKLGFALARPVLSRMDAEDAHRLTIEALKRAPLPQPPPFAPVLAVKCLGLSFPNPLGLAAGFDKNAEVPDRMLRLGFGFVEVGTVTPQPQTGNPRPRLFRLVQDQAVINRMGFNNAGHEAAHRRLQRKPHGIVGVNIGANKDITDRAADYVAGIAQFSDVADYFAVNISSPNTPGLRNLQSADELHPLLARLNEARSNMPRRIPMLLKIAPDLDHEALESIARCCENGVVDGVILTNTTLFREGLASPEAREAGGLSGRPLFDLSTRQLAKFYVISQGRIPLVGVGGIASAEDAWMKICAGASLLQLYSVLVYKGPTVIIDILNGLAQRTKTAGFASIMDAVGSRASDLAYQKPGGR